MLKWLRRLGKVCGLNTTEKEDPYKEAGEGNESPQTGEDEHRLGSLRSGESSPALSSSSPYIPISECFSGKPLQFNGTPGALTSSDSAYCNTTSLFPFPPTMSCGSGSTSATSPTKTTSRLPPVPPPRPPKKQSPSPSSVTYLQLDTEVMSMSRRGEPREVKIHSLSKVSHHKRNPTNGHVEEMGSGDVEYRMIDHVKTKALNQMILDREEQLRTTKPMIKNFSSHRDG